MKEDSFVNGIFTYGRKVGNTTNGVHEGALVKIAPKASMWNGQEVARWYTFREWYVENLEGNRAKLGKDKSGTRNANFYISTNFLTVIKTAAEVQDGASDPEPSL